MLLFSLVFIDSVEFEISPTAAIPAAVTTAGTFALTAFTVTAPTTLTLDFDYRLQTSAGGNSPKANISFELSDGATTYPSGTVNPNSDTGGYVPGSVSIPVTGSGPVTITDFSFNLEARPGQPKTVWIDNLVLTGPGGGGVVSLLNWQEIVSN